MLFWGSINPEFQKLQVPEVQNRGPSFFVKYCHKYELPEQSLQKPPNEGLLRLWNVTFLYLCSGVEHFTSCYLMYIKTSKQKPLFKLHISHSIINWSIGPPVDMISFTSLWCILLCWTMLPKKGLLPVLVMRPELYRTEWTYLYWSEHSTSAQSRLFD